MPSLGDILPEVGAGPIPDASGMINPLDNPEASNAAIAAALADTGSDWPKPEGLESDLVDLPGGITLEDGTLIKHGRVKELTGADEEAIARSSVSLNPFHFINTLLECGVAQIGDQPVNQTKALLKRLLVGDRDALIMGIRKVSYTDEVDISEWTCPNCQQKTNLNIPLADIPIKELDTPGQTEFDVPLRKGRTARIALANGADQLAVFENTKLNIKERDTILLERTLVSIKEANGATNLAAGLNHTFAVNLSMADRSTILKELATRQPGPQFGEIKFTHDACGEDVTIAIGIGDLFPDL